MSNSPVQKRKRISTECDEGNGMVEANDAITDMCTNDILMNSYATSTAASSATSNTAVYATSSEISNTTSNTTSNATNRDAANIKCNCQKSKCLKLYCECFARELSCGLNCMCINCSNIPGFEKDIIRAKNAITRRNPTAFDKKIVHGTMHSRGCKCKTSRCLKRYCECFQSGVQCTQFCECLDCQNGKDGLYSSSLFDTTINSNFNVSQFERAVKNDDFFFS